jgi:hypothetical protein
LNRITHPHKFCIHRCCVKANTHTPLLTRNAFVEESSRDGAAPDERGKQMRPPAVQGVLWNR